MTHNQGGYMEKTKRAVLVSPELAKGHALTLEDLSSTHFVGEATLPPGPTSTWLREQTYYPRISSVDTKRGFLFAENGETEDTTMLQIDKDIPQGITYANSSVAYSEGMFHARYAIIESEGYLETTLHHQHEYPENHIHNLHELAHHVSERYPACIPTGPDCLQENDILQLAHAETIKAEGGGTIPENATRWRTKHHLCRVAKLYTDAVEVETIPGHHTETNQEMQDKIASSSRRIILGKLAIGTPDYTRAQEYEHRHLRTHFSTGGDTAVGSPAELTYALHHPTPQHVRDAIGAMSESHKKKRHFSFFSRKS